MKKVLSIVAVAALSVAFVSCGPSKEELAAKAKASEDSTRMADSTAAAAAAVMASATRIADSTAAATVAAADTLAAQTARAEAPKGGKKTK